MPVVTHVEYPEYSVEARQAKLAGTVLIGLIVDKNGRPMQVHVMRGLGKGLDKALEAVRQYRFKPAMENGQPVPVALNVEVNFQIFKGPPDTTAGPSHPGDARPASEQ